MSKYFRKAGVPQLDEHGAVLRDAKGDIVTGPERSVKQVVRRLAGCWRHWGETYEYFETKQDAQAFEDELSKARGKTQLTGDMNKAVFGRGSQSANTRLAQGGFANSGIDSGVAAFNQLSGQGNTQGNTTVPNTPEWKDPGTASSPDEWNQFPDSSDGASKLGDEDDR